MRARLTEFTLAPYFSSFCNRRSESGTNVEAINLGTYAITPPSTCKYGSFGAEADITVYIIEPTDAKKQIRQLQNRIQMEARGYVSGC
jgi:hypothetical protein